MTPLQIACKCLVKIVKRWFMASQWHILWWSLMYCFICDWLMFYVLLKNISLLWRRHHYLWRAAKFRPMLGAQGLSAGRDLYPATPAVTRYLVFFRSHPKDHPIQSPFTTHKDVEDLFYPGSFLCLFEGKKPWKQLWKLPIFQSMLLNFLLSIFTELLNSEQSSTYRFCFSVFLLSFFNIVLL
jgi:hypothetical protein